MTSEAARAVIVIGGGIAGLACAWRLHRAGVDVLCVEAANRPGGALCSRRVDDFIVEAGANTVQENASLAALIREVGLVDELLNAPRRLTRFIYRFGALHPLPTGLLASLASGLISARAKARLLREVAVARRTAIGDESVEAFVRRRFGTELVDALVSPFVAGTFAGDPAVLSARAVLPSLVAMEEGYGGILRGMLASAVIKRGRRRQGRGALISFRGGLDMLPTRLAAGLGNAIRMDTQVLSITRPAAGAGFEIDLRDRMGGRSLPSRAVVVACSAWAAASLLEPLVREASQALAEIPAASLVTVSLAWPRAAISHPLAGIGFLVAGGERIRTLGCLWNSSIFPGRAPADQASFTAFLGGTRDPHAAALSDDALIALAGRELGDILGARGRPRALAVERHARALPQYVLGHAERMKGARARIAAVPGLFLAGNYLTGVSVGDCAREGERAAAEVCAFLGEAVDFSRHRML